MVNSRPIWLLSDRRYLKQRMPTAVRRWLEAEGHTVGVVLADGGEPVSALSPLDSALDGSPLAEIRPGDLVVCRTRHPFGLTLLALAEARGARSYDSAAAVEAVRDKVQSTLALEQAGVPVPESYIVHRPEHLRRLPAGSFPLLLKPRAGDNANGLRLVRHAGDLEWISWPEPVVVAQRYVDVGGMDVKLYVADDELWAIRRPSPLVASDGPVVPVPVTSELASIANACRGLFDLRLFGVDVLQSASGPLVVDVNEFPNYTGVEDAPAVIGGLMAAEAEAPLAAAGGPR